MSWELDNKKINTPIDQYTLRVSSTECHEVMTNVNYLASEVILRLETRLETVIPPILTFILLVLQKDYNWSIMLCGKF